MEAFFEQILFTVGDWTLNVGQVTISLLAMLASFIFYKGFIKPRLFTSFFERNAVEEEERKKLNRLISFFLFLVLLLVLIKVLNADYQFFENQEFIKISLLLEGLLIIQGARLLDWVLSNILIHKNYINRDKPQTQTGRIKKDEETTATKVVQYIVYLVAVVLLLSTLDIDYTFFSRDIVDSNDNITIVDFKLSKVLTAILILLISRLITWLITQLFLYGLYKRKDIDPGSQYAINQLLKYFIYFIAVFIALDHLGINMTLIWTGAAALLVGIGLGLQQTFSDFISGIVLLFERSTSVGDVLEFEGKVGMVRKIGLRSSIVETIQNITLVVPNSKLVNNNVTNWSHFNNKIRFEINVGVAYGSDTEKVKNILTEVANDNNDVLQYPESFVRFADFGDSALSFVLCFYSKKYMKIDVVKSDLRFEIDKRFREEGVTIPFPQRDVWMR